MNQMQTFGYVYPSNEWDCIKINWAGSKLNVNEKDNEGKTALMLAWENGKTDTVSKLVKLGANVNEKDNYGNVW